MSRIFFVIGGFLGAVVFFAGCEGSDNRNSNVASHYDQICLNGITYWRGTHQLAPKFLLDGSLERCPPEAGSVRLSE